jgi:ribose transport system substrate-binding protein
MDARHRRRLRLLALIAVLALLAAACGGGGEDAGGGEEAAGGDAAGGETAAAEGGGEGPFTIAVSNTLVGNGWREQMICAVQAEAAAEGDVDRVVVFNENGAAPEQIRHVEQAISQGVDALIINPSSTTELNSILEEAVNQGLVVVAVDQALEVEGVYNVTNDQEAYGRLGMEWLAEELGGQGRVVVMNGIDGAPANEARRAGIDAALEAYPDIEIAQETFTGWDFSVASQQALDLLGADPEIDGIWTSGTDYTVANAFETANMEPVPVVGADTNEFQRLLLEGAPGVAVTNPAIIGGVGVDIALQVLRGEEPDTETVLEPQVWDVESAQEQLEETYSEDLDASASTTLSVDPYTSFSPEELRACEAVG